MTIFITRLFKLSLFLLSFGLNAQEVRLNFMPSNGERGEDRSFDLAEFVEQGREDGFISKSEYEKIQKQLDNYYKKSNKLANQGQKGKSKKSGRSIASVEENRPRIIETVSDMEIKEYHEFVNDIDAVLKAVE